MRGKENQTCKTLIQNNCNKEITSTIHPSIHLLSYLLSTQWCCRSMLVPISSTGQVTSSTRNTTFKSLLAKKKFQTFLCDSHAYTVATPVTHLWIPVGMSKPFQETKDKPPLIWYHLPNLYNSVIYCIFYYLLLLYYYYYFHLYILLYLQESTTYLSISCIVNKREREPSTQIKFTIYCILMIEVIPVFDWQYRTTINRCPI